MIAVAGPDGGVCAGTLIAPDVVLTARACADGPDPPSSTRILVGDALGSATERARASDVIPSPSVATADPCDPGLAAVLLDTPIGEVRPLAVRATGAARGDRLRTVTYAVLAGGSDGQKIARDHLPVLAVGAGALRIAEACVVSPGGPAVDEETGEVVGVAVCNAGALCGGDGAFDVYARTDTLLAFVAGALAKSGVPASGGSAAKATRKGPIDMGASCTRADDCAAGVCVDDPAHGGEYCSRTCDDVDRCPAHFRCRKSSHVDASSAESVCVEG